MGYALITPDDAVQGTYRSRRAALAAARRLLGVDRLVHADDRRPTGGGTYWLHASRNEGCASVKLVRG